MRNVFVISFINEYIDDNFLCGFSVNGIQTCYSPEDALFFWTRDEALDMIQVIEQPYFCLRHIPYVREFGILFDEVDSDE